MSLSKQEAYEILVKHEVFFAIYNKDKYLPRAQEPALNEITAALRVINPEFFKGQNGCRDRGILLILEADRTRLNYLKSKPDPKRYEF